MNEDIKKTINKIIFTHATTKQWPTVSSRLVLSERGGREGGPTRPAEWFTCQEGERSAGEGGASGSESTWQNVHLRVPAGTAALQRHKTGYCSSEWVVVFPRGLERSACTWTQRRSDTLGRCGSEVIQGDKVSAGDTVTPQLHSGGVSTTRFVSTSPPLPADKTAAVCL